MTNSEMVRCDTSQESGRIIGESADEGARGEGWGKGSKRGWG